MCTAVEDSSLDLKPLCLFSYFLFYALELSLTVRYILVFEGYGKHFSTFVLASGICTRCWEGKPTCLDIVTTTPIYI